MRVKVTFECWVCPGVESAIEKLIRYNFAHVKNIEIKEIEDTEDGNN